MEALALGRRIPVCIGPSERTVTTAAAAAAAVRVGYVCLFVCWHTALGCRTDCI
jgi:hypothetical protein